MIEHFKAKTKETWCNIPVKDIIAYLEKQKEKSEIPIMDGDTDTYFDDLRMTTKPLTSREWFYEGIKYAQRLQKERGPLTKEEEYILHRIIEYLEDETCPSEWISLLHDIYCLPYEKQKEQKPNIELIQRSWYMEGYNDRKFGNEPKWIIKTGEGGPKHELNPRYGQPLTERQVTEEQLHNLNEAIKSFRMDGFDRIADSLHSLYNILTTQAQKPAEWSEEDEQLLGFIYDLLADSLWNSRYAMSRDECLDRLTSLRQRLQPRPSWKPSEEQQSGSSALKAEGTNE